MVVLATISARSGPACCPTRCVSPLPGAPGDSATDEAQTGRLVEEGDRMAMAEAMALLADRPDLAGAWGAAGQRRAQARFTVGHHVEQITTLLNALVEHNR